MGEGKKVLHVIPGYGGGISSLVRNIVTNSDIDVINNDVVGFTEYPDYFVNEVHANKGKCFTLPSVKSDGKKCVLEDFVRLLKVGHTMLYIYMYTRINLFSLRYCVKYAV